MTLTNYRGLTYALTVSLLLHALLLAGRLPSWFKQAPPQPSRLDVSLIIPESADPVILEKNTIAEELPPSAPMPPPPPPPASKKPQSQAPAPQKLSAKQQESALRKVSPYIFYPQAAQDAGLEGTVHLMLTLAPDGAVLEASVAASSGHPILDNAAINAVMRAGRLNTGGKTQIILPFTFRLQ